MNKAVKLWSMFSDVPRESQILLVKFVTTKGEITFSHHVFFFPQGHLRRQVEGEGGPPLFSYMEIPPPPKHPQTPPSV